LILQINYFNIKISNKLNIGGIYLQNWFKIQIKKWSLTFLKINMAEIFENKGSFVKKINGTNGGFSKNRRNSSRVLVRNEKRIEAFNKT